MIQHWISSNVLLTAFLVLAGGWLLLKSRLGQIAIVLLILFFMVNDRLFSQSDLPVGGAAGNAMQAAQFGVNAQSNEAICLGKAMTARTAQSSNPRLAGAAAACTQVQAQAIRQCAQQTANLLVADKLVKCQGEAEPAWSKCMSSALVNQAEDGSYAVAHCSENRLIGLMRDAAGMFSFAKWFPPKQVTYNAGCLRIAFNRYATQNPSPLPQLHCDQMLNDPARLQACIIQSLTQGLGTQSTALVAQCQDP